MCLRNRPQLPSIDYVLSSVALSYNLPPSTEATTSPTLYEPFQTVLLQWANMLTAPPHTRCELPQKPQRSQIPQFVSTQNNCHSGAKLAGLTHIPQDDSSIPIDVMSTAPKVEVDSQHQVQQEVQTFLHRMPTTPSKQDVTRHPDTSTKPSTFYRPNHHTLTPVMDPPVRQESRKSAIGKKNKTPDRRKYQSGTTEVVIDQLATCRERLSEIAFRAIERPDGLMECSICHEAYRTKTLVTRHAISHSDDPKPFFCSICNKRFSRRDTLHRHTKRKACKVELPRSSVEWKDSCHVLKTKP